MITIKKIIFLFIISKFIKTKKNLSFKDLNFKKIDFTNKKQIKTFIFKKEFFKIKNKNIHTFDFLNFSKNLGGKIGINLSKNIIFGWYKLNKNKISFPWSDDLTSKRFLNIIYNYEFINSSSTKNESQILNKIILVHMFRIINDYNLKKLDEITSYDLVANLLSRLLLNKNTNNYIEKINYIVSSHVDNFGMHKSYNVLEHSKYINNLNELKTISKYFNVIFPDQLNKLLNKMNSVLNEYFHADGSLPLFNGTNNNYTVSISNSINKDGYLKSRNFYNISGGLAYYSDKNKKLFFDVVQPNNSRISQNLSAGTLSFEFSSFGEKIITNCGASEQTGKNPEYLRYSAAHSTVILQNTNISEIKEGNPHLKYPQSVTFNQSINENNIIYEGSHNGYLKKFNKIIKRKIIINELESKLVGEDSIISFKNTNNKIIYHIRFHLMDEFSYSFTNNKKNIILKSKNNNMWIFKSDVELKIEDSIIVDRNTTVPSKQIVIKGIITNNKHVRKWELEKI